LLGGILCIGSKFIDIQDEVFSISDHKALLEESVLNRFNSHFLRNLVDNRASLPERK